MADGTTDGDDDGVRSGLSIAKRLALVERDTRSHARSLTHIIDTMNSGFTEKQMTQLHLVMRGELSDIGLRLDDDHIDDARRDFMFLRTLRMAMNGTAAKIGWFFMAALLASMVWLLSNGLAVWKGH